MVAAKGVVTAMNCIGLDIGTTTISAVVLDGNTGKILASRNIANGADIAPDVPGASLQDAEMIVERARLLLEELVREYAPIQAIGIDGQMHGIVILDELGKAVSPLYTWQDARGNLPRGEENYVSELERLSGYEMSTGFGMTTLYWLNCNGRIPQRAHKICTIFDYVGMRLCGRREPLIHVSGAASMGLFDLDKLCWDKSAIVQCGINPRLLPEVAKGCAVLGYTQAGIPVSCGIGDNQASYIGSVRDMAHSVLVNIGTGGQVTVLAKPEGRLSDLELRPLCDDRFILAGSVLCAGRAYALLERFMHSCAALAGYDGPKLYDAMNAAAESVIDRACTLSVDTRFCGTRREEQLRGSIRGIGIENFDAAHLISGVLRGIVEEIYALYCGMLEMGVPKPTMLVGSGNGLRKNKALKKEFERRFGMKMRIPSHEEEAAYGAALYGMVAAGLEKDLADAQRRIQYQDEPSR